MFVAPMDPDVSTTKLKSAWPQMAPGTIGMLAVPASPGRYATATWIDLREVVALLLHELPVSTERTIATKFAFVSSLGDQTRPKVFASFPDAPGTPPNVTVVSPVPRLWSWRLVVLDPLFQERLMPRSQSASVVFATAVTRIPVMIEPSGTAGRLKPEYPWSRFWVAVA